MMDGGCRPNVSGLVFSVAFLTLSSTASAVVLNDRAAEAAGGIFTYYDRNNVHASVALISTPGPDGGICTGSLINFRTILTASHCVAQIAGKVFLNNQTTVDFSPDGDTATAPIVSVSGVAVHPGFDPNILTNDIALISLSNVVRGGIAPVRLVSRDGSPPPIGSTLRFVGYGATGTGSSPPDRQGPYDYKRRVGETLFGGVAPGRSFLGPANQQSYIVGLFHDPGNSVVPREAIPSLQAGGAPGDSGGPLFMMTEKGQVQIGVATWVVNSLGTPQFGYGSHTGWTQVVDYLDWIAANNPLREVTAKAGKVRWSDPKAWTDVAAGTSPAPDNREGSITGGGAIARYYQVGLAQAGTVSVDMDAEIDTLRIKSAETTLHVGKGRELIVYAGTEMTAGQISVAGQLSTSYLDLYGGVLSGNGTVFAAFDLININGVIAPGTANRIGSLTLDGGFKQLAGGTLSIRFANGTADALSVTGNATLGGTVHVSGRIRERGDRAVIVSAHLTDGRFARATDAFAFFDVSLGYTAQTVTANVRRNGLTFADVATLRNDKHAATAVQALGSGNAVYDAALQLGKHDATGAFDGLSGDIHASARSLVIDTSRYLRDAVTGRLRQGFGDPAFLGIGRAGQRDTGLTVWGQGFGTFGHADGSDVAALDTSTGGFFLGADRAWGDWRVGFAGGYSQMSLDSDRSAVSLTGDNYHFAAYGGTRWEGVGLALGGAYTWHRMDARRSIAFPGFSDALRSGESAGSAQVFADLSYDLTFGQSTVEPFLSLAYVDSRFDGFRESGGDAALDGRRSDASTIFSTLGVRATTTVDLTGDSVLTASMALGWRHASGDVAPRADLMFRNGGLPFSVTGTPIARDAIVVEAGTGLLVAQNATLNLRYSGQFASNSSDQGFKADLKWEF